MYAASAVTSIYIYISVNIVAIRLNVRRWALQRRKHRSEVNLTSHTRLLGSNAHYS